MNFIVNGLDYLFSNKRRLIYMSLNQKEYYTVISKLKAAGIKYRITTTSSYSGGGIYSDYGQEYKFYVKKQDEDEALEAIHKKV
ncbi:hypothetical protein LCL89_02215 [Halobacillus yeomjeoni]|uniref:DUF2007 domain-containing protein n=1 Tax=Halobacillus yeomjeoni TaxID=311194 RepID=A0A931MUX4_9BACI|nr:hypothetical protein [Halobacillus yeomjeoni]MBH0229769.1 hypothetical protein [Halobacillus yeomjeoni]MCA0982854.1 hypothetical protein [Halobacillus yeomjeoni]